MRLQKSERGIALSDHVQTRCRDGKRDWRRVFGRNAISLRIKVPGTRRPQNKTFTASKNSNEGKYTPNSPYCACCSPLCAFEVPSGDATDGLGYVSGLRLPSNEA